MTNISPPDFPLKLLKWFCKPAFHSDIEGDLLEMYDSRVEKVGLKKAKWLLLKDVLQLFRPGIVRSFQLFKHLKPGIMFRHNLLVSWRNIKRNKGYTAINVIGLAVGLACFILIGMFVKYEYSYDTFHEKADRVYRIAKENPGEFYLGTNRFAVTPAPLVASLREEFPEVEYATQIRQVNGLFELGDQPCYEDGIYATKEFFEVFTFPVIRGQPQTMLAEPNIIILTESMAQKYFESSDPVGKTLFVTIDNEKVPMEIAGIIRDIPANSHIAFDYIISMRSRKIYGSKIDHWDNNNYYTYASLFPDQSLETFEAKLNSLAKEKLGQFEYYKDHPDEITIFYPQALTDLHLRSHINLEPGVNGDIRYVRLFSGIAILILLIACINYINLSTARSVIRAKEVGIRKAIGAFRSQLTRQFTAEALIPTIFASLLALGLVFFLLPVFNRLTQREIGLLDHSTVILWLLFIGLSVGILAGIYPAHMLSRFNPVSTLKGSLSTKPGKTSLRNVLVVLQFAITIPLIISTIVIHRQLHFIHEANTGLNREMVVSFPIRDHSKIEHFGVLKETLLTNHHISKVSGSFKLPTQIISSSGTRRWEDAEEGQHISIYHAGVTRILLSFWILRSFRAETLFPEKQRGTRKIC